MANNQNKHTNDGAPEKSRRPPKTKWWRKEPQPPTLEAYWVERKRYLEKIRGIPELRRRYIQALALYLLRRFLWAFGFFPIFLAFWLPLVFNRFNPVAMADSLIPHLQAFVDATPQVQSSNIDTLWIAWLSVGFIFAVFDLVLTPFRSPYEYEADVHMRAWEEIHNDQSVFSTTPDDDEDSQDSERNP